MYWVILSGKLSVDLRDLMYHPIYSDIYFWRLVEWFTIHSYSLQIHALILGFMLLVGVRHICRACCLLG